MLKKGNVFDVLDAGTIILGLIIVGFIMWIVMDNFGTQIMANNVTNYTQINTFYSTYQTRYIHAIDYGVLLLAVLFPIFSFIASRRIPSDTIYLIMTFLILGLIVIFLMVISNIYGGFMDNTTFQQYVSQLSIVPFIMPNLHYYGIIYLFIVLTGLFTKSGEE